MALVNRTSVSTSNVRSVPANRTRTSKYCDVCYGAGKSFEEYTSHYVKSKMGPDGVVTCPTILNSICTYCKTKGHFKSACEVLKNKNKKMASGGSGVGVGVGVGVGGSVDVTNKKATMNNKSNEKKRQRDGNLIHKNKFDCLFLGDCNDDDSSDDENNNNRSLGGGGGGGGDRGYGKGVAGMDDCEFPPIHPPLVRSQTNKKQDRNIDESVNAKKMSYADALESAVKTFPARRSAASATAGASQVTVPSSEVSLLAFIQNKPPPFVTTRKYNANGTRKSWADYTESDSESGSDEDE